MSYVSAQGGAWHVVKGKFAVIVITCFPFLFFKDRIPLLLAWLECSGVISALCNLCLLSSSESHALASQQLGLQAPTITPG